MAEAAIPEGAVVLTKEQEENFIQDNLQYIDVFLNDLKQREEQLPSTSRARIEEFKASWGVDFEKAVPDSNVGIQPDSALQSTGALPERKEIPKSFRCETIGGTVLAVMDYLFGVYVLWFYGKIQSDHSHCPWAHYIRDCKLYLFQTNHSLRTKIGLTEGIVSIIFSTLLLIVFLKRLPKLAWSWLVKSVTICLMNAYFIGAWLRERRRDHAHWDSDEYKMGTLFITGGAIEVAVQLAISIVLFCFVCSLSIKIRGNVNAEETAETEMLRVECKS
ncbi:uncharacterized protein LOC108679677 isoform X1 [Hyalella azteca]|uniref:Uncharacterized protein LOC108679677 isoform X1 n=1 Tax=Hyalella azteca TaxID=294128 RepID=A0A8B7PE14_HYAAZ|nr:uncharacterized protein LOC108679677 isoform X1 [Hyalella azteca]